MVLYHMVSLFQVNKIVQHLERIFYKFISHHLGCYGSIRTTKYMNNFFLELIYTCTTWYNQIHFYCRVWRTSSGGQETHVGIDGAHKEVLVPAVACYRGF